MPNNSNYDHLQAVRDQAPRFNSSWLKHAESMPMIQRIGFTIISLVSCLVGFGVLNAFIQGLRESDIKSIFFAPPSALFLYFGFLGLRNVLRFPKNEASEEDEIS